MRGPYLRFGRRPSPPRRQNGVGQPLGLHEHLGEGGMRDVVGAADQRQLGIGRDVDGACDRPGVRQGDATDLRILLGRDQDLHARRQRAVAAGELGTVLAERHLVSLGGHADGLQPGRPDCAAAGVPQQDPRAPVVQRRVLPPPGDGQVPPPAAAGAGCRQHHGVASVGQQVGDGFRAVRPGVAPAAGWSRCLGGQWLRVHRQGPRDRHVARRPLLQQQFRRLDDGFRMEAPPHDPVQHGIGDRDDRHALVMRHEGPHHGHRLPGRNPARRVVQRLVEAIAALAAGRRKPHEVADRRPGIDHRRQRGGVGSDHDVGVQAALQAQTRDAKVGILVGVLHVAHVVGRFRHAPGHVMLPAEADLAPHDQAAGVLQQAAVRRAHHQGGHQVLEHRSRPGHQHGAPRHGCDGAAEPEPLAGRNVALGDGEEAGQPGLGRQEVVAVGVQRTFIREEADGQQLALRVAEKAELHRERHAARRLLDGEQPRRQFCRISLIPAVALDRPVQRGDPERQVRGPRLTSGHRLCRRRRRARVHGKAGQIGAAVTARCLR